MIYDNIKSICSDRGISISALERMAGLGNGTISRWNESSPRLDNIKEVADCLEVPLEELITERIAEVMV